MKPDTPPAVWVLGLALSCRGAAAFVVHMASYCPLPPNGSATPDDDSATPFGLTIAFNMNPLLCYEPDARRFVPCDGGLLQGVAASLAEILNNGSTWGARAESRRRACHQLGTRLGSDGGLRAPPQLRVTSVTVPNAPSGSVRLSCHLWGFHPPAVTVRWLRNGAEVAAEATELVPNGDGTYQTQVTLEATARAGDTFSCWAQHASLGRPLRGDWAPGWSPGLVAKVAAAAVTMVLGLVAFAAGTFCYCRQAPGPRAGPETGPSPKTGPYTGTGPGTGPSPGPGTGPGLAPSPHPGPYPATGPSASPAPGPHPGPTRDCAVTKL